MTDVVSKPGEYNIDVITTASYPAASLKNSFRLIRFQSYPVWTMEQPTITAPRVHIVVERLYERIIQE